MLEADFRDNNCYGPLTRPLRGGGCLPLSNSLRRGGELGPWVLGLAEPGFPGSQVPGPRLPEGKFTGGEAKIRSMPPDLLEGNGTSRRGRRGCIKEWCMWGGSEISECHEQPPARFKAQQCGPIQQRALID